ncbi:MAG: hypothetical protein JRI54_00100 [Deltaproteobacteria bacterium]|nr:hypothetical protein [Deltaproteobacteria bacterium]
MLIFTIKNGSVTKGAQVTSLPLKGAGISIPAILVGEEGRGRQLGVLPVQLLPEQQQEWEKNGSTTVTTARIGQTRAGNPKFFATTEADTDEKIIAVLRTGIGFRGGNSHTGDRTAEWWQLSPYRSSDAWRVGIPAQDRYTADEVREYSRTLMKTIYPDDDPNKWRWDAGFERHLSFAPFPGKILTKGVIAQGDAGRMGSGEQLIALISKDIVFRTGYSGRLYGAPEAHYYIWTGDSLLSATWEERQLADLF